MLGVCNGEGQCLQPDTQSEITKYIQFTDISCIHKCVPFPCPNEIVCGGWYPLWILKMKGICFHCDSMFHKKLEVVESAECPMCFETTTCIIQPNCSHPTCVSCFQRCRYGDIEEELKPVFPYDNGVEDEFQNGKNESQEWCERYPLIDQYLYELILWDVNREKKYEMEQYLRVCPLCRR